MKIFIVHHNSNAAFLEDLLASIHRPVTVLENTDPSTYELGALKRAMAQTTEDIFLLQDTCLVKDNAMFDIAESRPGGTALCAGFMSYLGKYSRRILDAMDIPTPKNKRDSVMWEATWTHNYIALDPDFTYLEPRLTDNHLFENKHGRTNMVLENQYLKKYKAQWGQKPFDSI